MLTKAFLEVWPDEHSTATSFGALTGQFVTYCRNTNKSMTSGAKLTDSAKKVIRRLREIKAKQVPVRMALRQQPPAQDAARNDQSASKKIQLASKEMPVTPMKKTNTSSGSVLFSSEATSSSLYKTAQGKSATPDRFTQDVLSSQDTPGMGSSQGS